MVYADAVQVVLVPGANVITGQVIVGAGVKAASVASLMTKLPTSSVFVAGAVTSKE